MTPGASKVPCSPRKRRTRSGRNGPREGQSALERTAAVLGPDAEVRLVPDDESTGAAGVRVAHEMSADVLVIGSSGKHWLSRLVGSSVSDYVAHHAPCPVMLVRHDH